MGTYRAIPSRFAHMHSRFHTPSFATMAAGIGTAVFYGLLTFVSENVLFDTIASLGIMICFYYGLTAFACVWYFRRELFASASNVVFKLIFPLVGGLILAWVFYISVVDSFSPDYGSGAEIGGVGLVFILAVGILALGAVLMVIWRFIDPPFFRGETLKHDTPSLVIPD
jgi:amino acid transporter